MEVYRFITWTWGRETEQSSYRQEGRLSYSMLAKIQRSATARKHDGLVDPYSGECMFNSTVLDVAIGMVFVYLLLSLLCTAVLEVIATIFKLRAKNLEAGIRSLFSDGFGPGGEAFVKQIYDHGLVAGLYRDTGVDLQVASAGGYQKPSKPGTRQLPSYIPSRTFALSLIDILNTAREEGKAALPGIKATITGLPNSKAKQALLSFFADANGEIEQLRGHFENWYNDAMDRASGWYKKRTQYILLSIGLFVAVCLNVDTINIARALYLDPGVRQATVAEATGYLKSVNGSTTPSSCTTGSTGDAQLSQLRDKLCSLQRNVKEVSSAESATLLPVGWKGGFSSDQLFRWEAIAGWILTAIALSLGAPFWFDLLNKFMVIRSTIKPQEKSPIEKSKA
jgi:hypothetical protein